MPLEPISLINAGIVIASIQGCAILWSKAGHRGICVLLLLLALSALMNILEAKGIAPYLTQFTPTFLLLFGPMLYLACSLLTKNALNKRDGLQFFTRTSFHGVFHNMSKLSLRWVRCLV